MSLNQLLCQMPQKCINISLMKNNGASSLYFLKLSCFNLLQLSSHIFLLILNLLLRFGGKVLEIHHILLIISL